MKSPSTTRCWIASKTSKIPRAIFVTATDTGAGKTWVTTHLLKALLAKGVCAQALKPIASGILASGLNEDVQILMDVQNQTLPNTNFHTFQTPVAPALAGQLEHDDLNPEQMLCWIRQKEALADITLIEGVGGLMAPLIASEHHQWLVSDWLVAMPDAEIMLVVPLRLGSMNQVLLNCTYLASIQRPPKWIVFNDLECEQTGEETMQLISPYLIKIFGKVPDLLCVQQASDLASIL